MSPEKQEKTDVLNQEASNWLDDVLSLTKVSKTTNLDSEESKLMWAYQWTSVTDKLDKNLEEFLDNYTIAETFKEIDSTGNAPMIDRLIDVLNAVNIITGNMYKITNQSHSRRILAAKESAEARLHSLQEEGEELTKLLDSRKQSLRRQTMEKKWASIEINPEQCRTKMREKAQEEHKKYLAQRSAIEALNSVDTSSIILRDMNMEDDEILREQPTIMSRRKQRRSRSLTRKVIVSMKRTFRRSVSAIHNIVDHNHGK